MVPTPDETRGAVVKAFVLLAPGHAPSEPLKDSLREHVKRHLAPYQQPREKYRLNLRSLMSGGEALGAAVFHWVREELGVTANEIFGQTEMNYIVGN